MQLHTFMLGIDVARRALLVISPPPFRYLRRGEARAKDKNLYLVWGDDTIWKMLGQLCVLPRPQNLTRGFAQLAVRNIPARRGARKIFVRQCEVPDDPAVDCSNMLMEHGSLLSPHFYSRQQRSDALY